MQCIVAVNRIQLAMKMVGHIHKFQTIFIVFSLSRVLHFMKFGTSQKQINYFSSEHFVTWNHILFVGTCTNSIKHVPWQHLNDGKEICIVVLFHKKETSNDNFMPTVLYAILWFFERKRLIFKSNKWNFIHLLSK